MDQRFEQMQKEMQEQLQAQMQEQLAKIQQEMRDQMLESQRNMLESQNNMISQLTQLFKGGSDKGKSPMVDTGNDNEDSAFPTSFAPVNMQTQPPRVSVNVQPLYQTGTSAPVNFPTGLSTNPGDNLVNPQVPDFDNAAEVEKTKAEVPKQFEDRCKWLEEKFKELENADHYCGIDAKKLSLVPNLVLPPKFKMPEFERYNGTSCPEAHITMFCQRMTGYVNNDQLLIHYFQDSLSGAAAKWYNQLSRCNTPSLSPIAGLGYKVLLS
ncbi:uncharacterized protein LOC128296667 [Gossypium arboreum]|uniref:uncharacterized protein LOC128296667 n=1 Tax=Gossypium arboreum TaxID=29729 RepID=UPI0022F1A57C|nr:uncharacterized protein LOC128296667 [Gossypium arboreum]